MRDLIIESRSISHQQISNNNFNACHYAILITLDVKKLFYAYYLQRKSSGKYTGKYRKIMK